MKKKTLLNKAKHTGTFSGHDMAMKRVCRTCMSPYELLPLFPLDTHYRSFERALFISTGLQIKANDGLPQHICQKCARFIESAIRFRSQCKFTESGFLQILKYKKKSVSKYSDVKGKIMTGFKNEHSVPKTEILVEFEQIKMDPDVDTMKMDDDDEVDFYNREASSPEDAFLTSEDEDLHKKRARIEAMNASRTAYLDLAEEPVDMKGPIKCKICKKTSRSVNAFEKHAKTHTGYEIVCEFCALRCMSKIHLLRHQRAKHGVARDNKFPCSYCDFKALDKEMKESHERRVHTKERPYVCDECGEAFYTKRVLNQHRNTHKTEKPFQCDICSMKFKVRTRLSWHIKTVHMGKNLYKYSCYLCQKMYNGGNSARKHIVNVHGVPKSQQRKLQRFRREDFDNQSTNENIGVIDRQIPRLG